MGELTGTLTLGILEAEGVNLWGKSDHDIFCIGSIDSVPQIIRLPHVKASAAKWEDLMDFKISKARKVLLYCGMKDETISADRSPPTTIDLTSIQWQAGDDGSKRYDGWFPLSPSGKIRLLLNFIEASGSDTADLIEAQSHAFEQPSFHKSLLCRFCEKFVWGSSVKCKRCHAVVHHKCSVYVADNCTGVGWEKGKTFLKRASNMKKQLPPELSDSLQGSPTVSAQNSLQPPSVSLGDHSVLTSFNIRIDAVLARNLHTNKEIHSCFVRFNWNGEVFDTETVRSPSPSFTFHRCWVYNALPSQLHDMPLTVSCVHKKLNGETEEIGSTTQSLEEVLLGPVHHDIMLTYNGKPAGRLAYNIHMEGVCEVTVQFKNVAVEGMGVLDMAAYRLDYSIYTDDETLELHKSSTPTENTRQPRWNGASLFPEIKFSSTKMGLDHAKVRLRLFARHGPPGGAESTIGDAWISLSRFLHGRELSNKVNINFTCKVWHVGRAMAAMSGTISISGVPMKFQQVGGVRTEAGVLPASPIIIGDMPQTGSLMWLPISLKGGSKLPERMETLQSDLKELDENFKKPYRKRNRAREKQLLGEMHEILTLSYKSSMVAFTYANASDVNQSVKIMLNVWQVLLNNADDATYESKRLMYMIISAIMQRSELTQQLMSIQATDLSNDDVSVLTQFRKLLLQTVAYCIYKLNSRMMFDTLREFCARVLVVAYFQLPSLRARIINAILPQQKAEQPCAVWRGVEFDVDSGGSNANAIWPNAMVILKANVDTLLQGKVDQRTLDLDAAQVPKDDSWLQELTEASELFYVFVCHFCYHVTNMVVVKDQLNWGLVPGYSQILKAFMLEMTKLKPDQYTEPMLKATEYLLLNSGVLNSLVWASFGATSVYDADMVTVTLTHLDTWLAVIGRNGEFAKPIPTTFDFEFFCQGLSMLLECDHCLVVSNALCILYNHIDTLCCHYSWRRHLLGDFLLEKYFYRLFLHYDYTVRQYFQVFLVYHILPPILSTNIPSVSAVTSMSRSVEKTPQPVRKGSTLMLLSSESAAEGGAQKEANKDSILSSLPTIEPSGRASCLPSKSEDNCLHVRSITETHRESQERIEGFAKNMALEFSAKVDYVRKRSASYHFDGDGYIHDIPEDVLKAHESNGPVAVNFVPENLVYAKYALLEFDRLVSEFGRKASEPGGLKEMPVLDFVTRMEGRLDLTD